MADRVKGWWTTFADKAKETATAAGERSRNLLPMTNRDAQAPPPPPPPPPPPEGDGIMGSLSLSFGSRLYGFLLLLVGGLVLCFLSIVFLTAMRPVKFAASYTLGNLFALGSVSFLVGLRRQVRSMFAESRAVASTVYLVAMFFTLYAALVRKSATATFLCVFVQLCALVWYAASYVPMARTCIRGMVRAGGAMVRRVF